MKFKKSLLAVAAALSLSASPAFAGIPVIDLAAITQAIMQVKSWGQQASDMVNQIKNMENQLNAIKGGRGMGLLLNDPSVRQAMGPDFLTTFDSLRSLGAGGASASAKSIYDAIKTFDCTKQFLTAGPARTRCEANAMIVPSNLAMLNDSLEKSKKRTTELQKLIDQVDGASDVKAAADLQNRIQAEMALLQNEKTLMDLMRAQMEAQAQLTAQQNRELGLKRLLEPGENPFNH